MDNEKNMSKELQSIIEQAGLRLNSHDIADSVLFVDPDKKISAASDSFPEAASTESCMQYLTDRIQQGDHVYIFGNQNDYPYVLKSNPDHTFSIRHLHELGNAPEPKEKPNFWKRFANRITGGKAYQSDIKAYQSYQEQLKEHQELETELREAALPIETYKNSFTAKQSASSGKLEAPLDIDLDGILDGLEVEDEFDKKAEKSVRPTEHTPKKSGIQELDDLLDELDNNTKKETTSQHSQKRTTFEDLQAKDASKEKAADVSVSKRAAIPEKDAHARDL